jgi:hypothetical protein
VFATLTAIVLVVIFLVVSVIVFTIVRSRWYTRRTRVRRCTTTAAAAAATTITKLGCGALWNDLPFTARVADAPQRAK